MKIHVPQATYIATVSSPKIDPIVALWNRALNETMEILGGDADLTKEEAHELYDCVIATSTALFGALIGQGGGKERDINRVFRDSIAQHVKAYRDARRAQEIGVQ